VQVDPAILRAMTTTHGREAIDFHALFQPKP
jgi:hypothetical protein